MSTKKQISSLCKLYSVYEEIPENFLDKPDGHFHFYHQILDLLQSHHRIVRVNKGSNKKFFLHSKCFILPYKVTATIYSQGRSQLLQKKDWVSLDSLVEFLNAFDQANKV